MYGKVEETLGVFVQDQIRISDFQTVTGAQRAKYTLIVSIINYQTADLTIAAAESVLVAFAERQDMGLVIVDNASGDQSAEAIADWIADIADRRVRLVRSPTNIGFSGGHNQAMAEAPNAEFYLVLNSDALLRPVFFETILDVAQAAPDAGLIAPRLEWEDGRVQTNCFRFVGPVSEFIRAANTAQITALLKNHVVALPVPPDPAKIDWASFACILLRGDMVRQIGPLDEGYFLYFEDAEYALRAKRHGWGVTYAESARAVHFRGGSGSVKARQATKRRLPAYYWQSRTRFLRQSSGPLGPVLGNVAWVCGRLIARLRPLAGREVPKANKAEWRDIWANVLTPLRSDAELRK